MKPQSLIVGIASATILLSAIPVEQAISQTPDGQPPAPSRRAGTRIHGRSTAASGQGRGPQCSGFRRPDSGSRCCQDRCGRGAGSAARSGRESQCTRRGWQHSVAFRIPCPVSGTDGTGFHIRNRPAAEGWCRGWQHQRGRTDTASRGRRQPRPARWRGGAAPGWRHPNRKDRNENTPLRAAVGPNLGWPSIVGALLNGGADPEMVNGSGLTALQLFVRMAPDQGDTVAALLDMLAPIPTGLTPMGTRRADDDAGRIFPSGTVRSRIRGHGQHVDRVDPRCIRSKCFEIPNSGAGVQVESRVCFSRVL